EFQLLVLRASDFYLLVQSCKRGFRSIQRLLIIDRIDFEKQVALFYQLVVLDGEFNELATGAWDDSDDVGARGRVVGARMPFQHTPDIKRENNCTENDQQCDELANELLALSSIFCCRVGTLCCGRRTLSIGGLMIRQSNWLTHDLQGCRVSCDRRRSRCRRYKSASDTCR